jgi:hypothetical protein
MHRRRAPDIGLALGETGLAAGVGYPCPVDLRLV